MGKMNVIEFAEMRMEQEERNDCYDLVKYWAAYRDGAVAQRKEDRLLIEQLLAELKREHPESRLRYEVRL